MDEQTNLPPSSTQPDAPSGATAPAVISPPMTPEQVAAALDPDGASIKENAGAIIDKTVADIKGDADKLAEGAGQVLDAKVRHPAHDVLDDMEQHLSQFDHYAVAVYHGFLARLRALL